MCNFPCCCDIYSVVVTMSDKETTSKEEKEEDSTNDEASGSGFSIDAITNFIAEKLHISIDNSPPILESPTVDALVEYIQSGKCKNIITLVGAGISTSAGIPDFRSEGTGLYANLQKYNLSNPEDIFFLGYFKKNPNPFFDLARELYPGQFNPTKSHYFVKLLEQKGLLLRHYTQNIDTLERVAGISEDKLVEAHGSFHTGHCMKCKKEYTQEWMKDEIFNDKIPKCTAPGCSGVVKPDIVFFGENLPARFYKLVESDYKKCDLLIIMGSSLTVQPVAGLIHQVSKKCPRVLINREHAGGMLFNHPKNVRNIEMLGDCDDQVQILVDKLSWNEDLDALMNISTK